MLKPPDWIGTSISTGFAQVDASRRKVRGRCREKIGLWGLSGDSGHEDGVFSYSFWVIDRMRNAVVIPFFSLPIDIRGKLSLDCNN
jgi:hypothetical protein